PMATADAAVTVPPTIKGKHTRTKESEARISFWGYPAVNASLSLVLGSFPFIVGGTVTAASAVAIGTRQQINLGLWHGFTPALGLSGFAIVVGAITVWQLPAIEAFMVPRPLAFSGLGVVEKLRQATIDFGAVVSSWTSGRNPGRHLACPATLFAGPALAGWLTIDQLPE